ncbi:hypothetical protein BDA99DRAFT_508371, partial [Phascolomyces articulosus]
MMKYDAEKMLYMKRQRVCFLFFFWLMPILICIYWIFWICAVFHGNGSLTLEWAFFVVLLLGGQLGLYHYPCSSY